MTALVTSAIDRLEAALLQMPQADIVTVHSFLPGKYERKIIIPPWTVLSGAPHRTAYCVRLEQGRIAVTTDEGIRILRAPSAFAAPAGVRRVGRVLEEEVIWVDVYDNPDDEQDIDTLEERLYVIPECGLGERRAQIERDRADHAAFVQQLGMPEERLQAIVTNAADLIPMPAGFDVEVRASRIHGQGLFAQRTFEADALICPGRLKGCRTPAGRFINHSKQPNAVPVKDGDDIHAVALRRIHAGEEILVNYRDSMRVNIGLEIPGEMPCLVG